MPPIVDLDGDKPVIEPLIAFDDRTDPQAYVKARHRLLNQAHTGAVNSAAFQRMSQAIAAECEANTGIPYEEAARQSQDRIAAFMGLMQSSEAELVAVEAAIAAITDIRVTNELKKKWTRLINRTKALQEQCREDPAMCWVYVGRNDDSEHAGELFELAECHIDMFDIWNDAGYLHSLIEAPVGHGKSTNLRGQIVWEIGKQPELRCLYITDEKGKAEKTVMLIKLILRSKRFRAVFPEVRVLTRSDDAKDSSLQFTVVRKNVFARDPTFEGNGIQGRIQGNRYDRIYADDVCPPEVGTHKSIRDTINTTWLSVVEGRLADPKASRMRFICTPWHPDDIAGMIQREVREGRLKSWRVAIDQFAIKDGKNGLAIPIWSKWDTAFLEERKIRDGKNYDFKYALRFASKSDVTIRRIQYYNADPTTASPNGQNMLDTIAQSERWLSIDPAGTSGVASSDTGIVEVVLTGNGYAFVPRCWFYHCPIGEVIDRITELIFNASPPGFTGMHWEAQGGVKVGIPAVITMIQRNLADRGYTQPLATVMTGTTVGGARRNQSKTIRLKNCSGYLERGLVRFAGMRYENHKMPVSHPGRFYLGPQRGTELADLGEHILNFDPTRNTDGVDALTQWILHNQNRIRNPFADKLEEPVADHPKTEAGRLLANRLAAIIAEAEDGDSPFTEEEEFLSCMSGRERNCVA